MKVPLKYVIINEQWRRDGRSSAWKIVRALMSVYVPCNQKLLDLHEKTCMQIWDSFNFQNS